MTVPWGSAATRVFSLAAIAWAGIVTASASSRSEAHDLQAAEWLRAVTPAVRGLAASADPLRKLVAAEVLAQPLRLQGRPLERAAAEEVHAEAQAIYASARADSSEFVVLWLAATDCPFGDALCDRDGAIDALLRLEPDNAAPWFLALDRAVRRNDGAAINEALDGIGASRHYRQHLAALMRAWSDGYTAIGAQPDAPPFLLSTFDAGLMRSPVTPADRSAFDGLTGLMMALFRGHPRFIVFFEACSRDMAVEASRRARCRDAARVLLDADIVVLPRVATRILYRLADDDVMRAEAERAHTALDWMSENFGLVVPEPIDAEGEFDDDAARALIAAWRDHDSEAAVFAAFAAAADVPSEPPADWRPRYTLAEREAMK